MVATVAGEVAKEMQLDTVTVETAQMAGTVMNIGKMEVPAEWLTKEGALNEQERSAIRDAMQESAALLENIEFDGPVTETLRQSLEHWDGSGPNKLKGEDILVTARVIAAANAFVGMISPRSYRKAKTADEALDILMKAVDKEFDRKVVSALANYIDNRGGRDMMATLAQAPKKK
jgi:HD-GYP domain-containing protein (c-di-GMP phosphodiesterase class II)